MNKADRRRQRISQYKRSTYMSVNEYYKSCSDAKRSAERRIKQAMIENNGTRYRVMGGSYFHFTCGYCYKLDDKWYLRVHTVSGYTDYELTKGEVYELYL